MTRTATAIIAAAGLFAFAVPADAQSYTDLRARAMCQSVGATSAEMAECIRSAKRQMILQHWGQTLQDMGRQQQHRPYALPQHQYDMLRDAERRRYEYNQQFHWE